MTRTTENRAHVCAGELKLIRKDLGAIRGIGVMPHSVVVDAMTRIDSVVEELEREPKRDPGAHLEVISKLLRYVDHYNEAARGDKPNDWDEGCEKTPWTNRYGVVYGELAPPRPCSCGLDEVIAKVHAAFPQVASTVTNSVRHMANCSPPSEQNTNA